MTTLLGETDKIFYQMCLSFRRRQHFRGLKTQAELSCSHWLSSCTCAVQPKNYKHVGLFPSVGHSSCPSCSDIYPGVISAIKPKGLSRRKSRRKFQRMRTLLVLLYASASQCHLATCHAYYIKFHPLLRHRVHACSTQRCLSKREIKSGNATPLLLFVFRSLWC